MQGVEGEIKKEVERWGERRKGVKGGRWAGRGEHKQIHRPTFMPHVYYPLKPQSRGRVSS